MRRGAYACGNTKVAQLGRRVVNIDIRIRVGTTGFQISMQFVENAKSTTGRWKTRKRHTSPGTTPISRPLLNA